MKKIVSIITVLLAVLFVQAQTITQNGVSYRYNGKNPRTPIGGVYIKPVTADNGVVSNASNGSFSVVLKNLKMGSRIGNVKVTKQGMMVFNQQAVDEWNVRKDPLCLILCDANEFQKQKKNLIAIGERQAKLKYDKKLAELKKKNEAQQLQIDDYYNKLDSLEKEYQNALKHMDEYADVFARIDESEIDTLAQRAIELFNKGEIDESIRLFEQGNYMKKLDEALHTKSQAQNLRNVADSAEALADKDIEEYVKSIKAQVSAYQVKNDYEKVGELLKGMADRLQTLDAIGSYLDFCNHQNKFKEIEKYSNTFLKIAESVPGQHKEILLVTLYYNLGVFYQKNQRFSDCEAMYNLALEACYRLSKENSEVYLQYLASVFNILGTLYRSTQRFSTSDNMYKAALEIRKQLAKDNPEDYEADLAVSYNDLGNLYCDTQRFDSCEIMYKAALEIRKQLAKENPKVYEPDLANSYNNLGNLYCNTQRFDTCEIMYKAALEIRKRLAKNNPNAYLPVLSTTYSYLGIFYKDTKKIHDSEEMHKAALEIRKQLAKENPKVYEPDLANSYNNLGVLYEDIQRFNDCETMHKAALEIRKRLAKDNPKVYEPDLANSYNNLGNLYCDTQRFDTCEIMYKAALEIQKQLIKDNPKVYEPDLAIFYNNLGNLYCDTQRFDTCEIMYKAALEIRKRLVKENPKVYEPDLANSYNNIGELYYNIQRFCDCETMYKAALEIRKRLAKDSPKNYEPDLAISYNNLGALYHQTRNFIECEAAYKSALSILEHLSKDNPKVYEPDLAISYNNLGNLYRDTQRFTDSEIMLNFCSKIYSNLYEDNPLLYRKGFAYICYSLGISRIKNKKTKEAINAFEKSLTIIINGKEKEKSELLYTENLAELSVLYSAEKKYETAYNYNTELLELRKNYYFAEPANYKNDYSSTLVNQSFNANLLGKFKEGETYCLEALQVDSTKHIAYTNLAAALLFQGKIEEAEKIYRQYKSEFKDGFLDDFAEYERLQVIPKEYMADVERIKAMLQE